MLSICVPKLWGGQGIYYFQNNIITKIMQFDIFRGSPSFNEEQIRGLFFHWK
jgi:hypothetical protein